MNHSETLSDISRLLTRATSAAFALLGLSLFLAPEWAAINFPWNISPFVAMTMGGWYLGSAAVAWQAARLWRWSTVFPSLIFVWAFGLLEIIIFVLHADIIRASMVLFTPYLLVLLTASIAALMGIFDWIRMRPTLHLAGAAIPVSVRLVLTGFVAFTAYIAVPLLIGIARGGSIWPGTISLLTARAFGAFYLALAIALAPLIWGRVLAPIIALLPVGMIGSIAVTLPALVYINQFDFTAKPGGFIYIGTYVVAFITQSLILIYHRRRQRNPPPTA
jgi:hypothetical protein